MKILVINHSNNYVYGASKSLQNLLLNLEIEYDLIAPKGLLDKFNEAEIRDNFKGNLGKVYCFWLPSVLYIAGRESRSIKGHLYHHLINLFFLLNKKSLKKICNLSQYDYVYLNSTVLFPLIDKKAKYILHVRELFQGSLREFNIMQNKLRKTKGVVFIDQATYAPFSESNLNNIILNNPFDMTNLNKLSIDHILHKYGIEKDKVIFCILGKLIKLKGVDLVIKAFNNINNDNIILLVVGDVNGGNSKECLALGKKNSRIKFIGELENTDEIYKISDYIVRGDRVVALGRTTYEGLYASCDVILPSKDGSNTFDELKEYGNKCHMFEVGNVKSLTEVIERCGLNKVTKTIAHSNIESYIEQFQKFLNSL